MWHLDQLGGNDCGLACSCRQEQLLQNSPMAMRLFHVFLLLTVKTADSNGHEGCGFTWRALDKCEAKYGSATPQCAFTQEMADDCGRWGKPKTVESQGQPRLKEDAVTTEVPGRDNQGCCYFSQFCCPMEGMLASRYVLWLVLLSLSQGNLDVFHPLIAGEYCTSATGAKIIPDWEGKWQDGGNAWKSKAHCLGHFPPSSHLLRVTSLSCVVSVSLKCSSLYRTWCMYE